MATHSAYDIYSDIITNKIYPKTRFKAHYIGYANTGNVGNKDIQDVVSETGLQEISPTGRLYENFNNLVAKEKERLGANADIQTTGRNMLGTILGTRR